MPPKNLHDAALGCFLGALVGDAAGATLEFIGRQPTREEVDWAMGMPGGGVWNVAPGQITDDGELTLCLARGLAVKETFDLEAIACNYARWIDSHPFDIGNTTAFSLGAYRELQWLPLFSKRGYAGVMRQAASDRCMASKANGSLMRISPLGIWGHRFDDDKLADFARQDARLSHPNLSCGAAAACYTIAIANLMRKPGDRKAAFTAAKTWLVSQTSPTFLQNLPQNSEAVSGAIEVLHWLQDAENNVNVAYHPHIGFVKIAFTHAFRHLLLGSDYVEAIREILLGGGDTDTNACIVGGLVGAACGASRIPEAMKNAVLQCDPQQGKNPRPEFLRAAQVPELVENLI